MFTELQRKIASSTPLMFLYFAVIVGIILQPVHLPSGHFSWKQVLVVGLPAAVTMTVITKRRQQTIRAHLGATDNEQLYALARAVKTGIVPVEPELRRMLTPYIRMLLKKLQPTRKSSLFSLIFVYIIGFTNIAFNHQNKRVLIMGVAIIIGVTVMLMATKRYVARLEALLAQLGEPLTVLEDSPAPAAADAPAVPAAQNEINPIPEPLGTDTPADKRMAAAMIAACGLVLFSLIYQSAQQAPAASLPSTAGAGTVVVPTPVGPSDPPTTPDNRVEAPVVQSQTQDGPPASPDAMISTDDPPVSAGQSITIP